MREIGDKEFKEILLNLMIYFDKYCQSKQLQYFLFYGSLIGAMRHQGFIPWDDDIDVIMSRDDYERLVKTYDNSGRYRLVSIHNNEKYSLPLAKIIDSETLLIQDYGRKESVELGIYIDIFVFDGIPAQEEERKEFLEKAVKYTRCWGISSLKLHAGSWIKDIGRRLYYLPLYIRGQQYYLNKMDSLCRKYPYCDSDIVGNVFYPLDTRDWYYKEDLTPIRVKFEGGNEFVVPAGYDRCLTMYYGDWRTPPPESEQVSRHRYKVYWR